MWSCGGINTNYKKSIPPLWEFWQAQSRIKAKIVELDIVHSMSQDFNRGPSSRAIDCPGSRRFDGDSHDHTVIKSAKKWQTEALHYHRLYKRGQRGEVGKKVATEMWTHHSYPLLYITPVNLNLVPFGHNT